MPNAFGLELEELEGPDVLCVSMAGERLGAIWRSPEGCRIWLTEKCAWSVGVYPNIAVAANALIEEGNA